jgi:hypothetical protein
MVFGSDVVAAGNGRLLVRTLDGVELRDAASGAVVWSRNPADLTNTSSTISPDAVLIGKTCGGD